VKLFVDSNFLSPYAMSAFVALREKHAQFEIVPVNLAQGEHRAAPYAALSSTLRVPTLTDGRFHLSESSAICEFAEDTLPGTQLYSKDLQQKAKAREIQAWLRSDLMPIRQERPTEVIFLGRACPPLSEEAQAAAAKLFAAVESLLPSGADSLFGSWSIADTDLALMLNRLVFAGDKVPPRLAAYAQAQWQRPSVQEWVNMPRPAPRSAT
jgi:glutathione S-transferase